MTGEVSEVAIVLGDEEHFLVPTLRAARAIDRKCGGFAAAFERIAAMQMETMVVVAAAGLDQRQPEQLKALESKLFDAGLGSLVEPFCRYIELLANGGRAPATTGDQDAPPPKKS